MGRFPDFRFQCGGFPLYIRSIKDKNGCMSEQSALDKSLHAKHLQPNEEKSSGLADWVADNILKPAANAGGIEPYNAVSNAVSMITDDNVNLPKATPYEIKEASLLSPTWFAQSVSSGLAMVVPYALAGKAAGASMRGFGSTMQVQGEAALFLKSEQAASIIGAAAYDGMRDLRPGETRAGNALGGASAFFIFEKGNALARTMPLISRMTTRAATGAVGGTIQLSTSRLYSTGELPTAAEMYHSAVGGAAMNLTLPAAQRGIAIAAERVNMMTGRGVLADAYLNTRLLDESGNSPISRSATLALAAEKAPWVRVVDNQKETAYLTKPQKILLETGAGAEKIGHELTHHGQKLNLTEAKTLLKAGDNEGAWQSFRTERLKVETEAGINEAKIAQELGAPPKTEAQLAQFAEALPGLQASNGRTYEQNWRQEFEQFQNQFKNNGENGYQSEFAPEAEYAQPRSLSSAEWQRQASGWNGLLEKEKLASLKALSDAPQSTKMEIWQKAAKDPNQVIRFQAVEKLSALEPNRRVEAWKQLLNSEDYFVKLLALSKVSDLPSNAREDAIKFAIRTKSVLALDSREVTRGKRTVQEEYSPLPPDWVDRGKRDLLWKRPSEILLDQIATVPGNNRRVDLWMRALEDPRTSEAAGKNIKGLPPNEAFGCWTAAWNKLKGKTSGKDGLVEQIENLPIEERKNAMAVVLQDGLDVSGHAMAKAMKSVDEGSRISLWNDMFETARQNKEARERIAEPGSYDYWNRVRDTGVRGYIDMRRNTRLPEGLAASIEALPENMRAQAWLDTAALDHAKYGRDLISQIQHLPEQSRLTAIETAIQKFPLDNLEWSLHNIPLKDLPNLAKIIFDVQDDALRTKLIRQMPTWHYREATPEAKAQAMLELFDTANKHAKDIDANELRRWWLSLPEPESMDYPPPRPVQEHLAGVMEPQQLGRILFNKEDWSYADKLAHDNPGLVRKLAAKIDTDTDPDAPLTLEAEHMGNALKEYYRSGNLGRAARIASRPTESTTEPWATHDLIADMIGGLAKDAAAEQRGAALASMKDLLLTGRTHDTEIADTPKARAHIRLTLEIAAKIGESNPEQFRKEFVEPIDSALNDSSNDYTWRMSVARELAALQRNDKLNDGAIRMPDLRMPEVGNLTSHQKYELRSKAETALHDSPSAMHKLMGDGELGKLFPTIFGHHSQGGIVGRPQHGGHEYPLHAHTLLVVQRVRNHPDFAHLSEKEQTNVLWAALLHDVGKRPGKSDPGHEWASANLAWGVLRTMGYPVTRIQRIADLIHRHSDMSFNPYELTSTRMNSSDAVLNDLATYYRHPSAVKSLAILNESDIKSIDAHSKLWTPEVQTELRNISRRTQDRLRTLNSHMLPILTTELPSQFQLVELRGSYALMAHASSHLDTSFLKQLSLIESPEYSISASLITPEHKRFYHHEPSVVALVTGPFEHISQAYRGNLGTGTSVDWKGHVDLATKWSDSHNAGKFIPEVESAVRSAGVPRAQGQFGSLEALRRRLSQYDTLDELIAKEGQGSPYVSGQRAIFKSLTTTENGQPLKEHNEIKLNNPTVVGLGIIRRGKPVILENMGAGSNAAHVQTLLGGRMKPSWLVTDRVSVPSSGTSGTSDRSFGISSGVASADKSAVVIPEATWKEVVKRRLPLVVLD